MDSFSVCVFVCVLVPRSCTVTLGAAPLRLEAFAASRPAGAPFAPRPERGAAQRWSGPGDGGEGGEGKPQVAMPESASVWT